jgi:hypothetical protein
MACSDEAGRERIIATAAFVRNQRRMKYAVGAYGKLLRVFLQNSKDCVLIQIRESVTRSAFWSARAQEKSMTIDAALRIWKMRARVLANQSIRRNPWTICSCSGAGSAAGGVFRNIIGELVQRHRVEVLLVSGRCSIEARPPALIWA